MNNSGIAVGEICRYFNISPENVIVVYDDMIYPWVQFDFDHQVEQEVIEELNLLYIILNQILIVYD